MRGQAIERAVEIVRWDILDSVSSPSDPETQRTIAHPRIRGFWDARHVILGAIVFVIVGGLLVGGTERWVSEYWSWLSTQWNWNPGAYETQVVLDPSLTPGGIEENQTPSLETVLAKVKPKNVEFSAEDFDAMWRSARESQSHWLGSVEEREGPMRGHLYLCIWDVKGPFPAEGNGTAHVVFLWLDGLDSGSPVAHARVTWFEESRTVDGTLDDLKGTVRINRAVASSNSRDGKNPFVVEYDLTGLKQYKGVSTEMRANNKVTLNF